MKILFNNNNFVKNKSGRYFKKDGLDGEWSQ